MKFNKWTLALAAAGVLSLGSIVQAEEAQQHPVTSALSATTLSGYVDTSAIWKVGTGNTVVGRSYDGTSKQDGFNLNVVKLSLEKPLDETQWSAGYKVDLLFGPDANTFASTSSGVPTSQDFALKQAYVAVRAPLGNGLDFKLGVWDTIIGYEVFDAGNNPNYSRSYGYFLEPTTYTGLQASYHVAEWMTITGGVADPGAAATINNRSAFAESIMSYMGAVTLTAPESWGFLKGATAYGGIVEHGKTAPANPTGPAPADVFNFYGGVTIPTPLTGLSVGGAYDYQGRNQNGVYPSYYANAASLYVTYQMDKWKFNNRVEYATGSDGSFGVTTGQQVELFGETFTVDYALWENVITRAELRWDKSLKGGVGPFGIDDQTALSVALNVIYKF